MTIEKLLNGEQATLVVVGRLDTQTAFSSSGAV